MRLNGFGTAAALGFAILVVLAGASRAEAVTVPNGFEERTVVAGLTLPTAIAFAPDGRMFVAEKDGVVRVVTTSGSIVTLLDISAHVNTDSDRGLEGIAVDTDFASNHYLYLLYVYEPAPSPSGLPRTSRLTRVTVNADNTASAETTLLGHIGTPPCPAPSNTIDCLPADGLSHMVGTVRSDTDGTLWVGNGDASDYNNVDPTALRTYDEQSLSGKIMHIDRNGNGLPGHAFCPADTDLTHVCTKLYAKGFRNPYRFALRPGTGPAVGDVGWNNHEEESLVTGPGRNYGWPCYEGPYHTNGYKDFAACQAEYAKEGTAQADTPPDYVYDHPPSTNYSAAIIGGPVYPGGSYPADFQGDVFVADYVLSRIQRLKLDSQGHVTDVVDFETGSVAVDLELGPANDLYYVDFGDGNPGTGSVRRIVYTPQNGTPIARATATPTFGDPPLDVSFNGAGSSDPDGDPLTYEWDFGDGSPHRSVANPSHTYATAGEYEAKLTVTDDHGASGTSTVRVSVGNSPPAATIQAPVEGSEFFIGDTIQLRGAASDAEDGQLAGLALQWRVSLIHNTHVHDLTGLTGAETSFSAATDHDANSHYRITLIATDSGGRSDTKVVQIYPRAINLTLQSTPPGAPITYGGSAAPAPYVQRSAIGFVSSISAEPSFEPGGTRYDFAGWSDGGARAHNITIPATDSALTARYRPHVWFEAETMNLDPADGVTVRDLDDPDASGGAAVGFRKSPSSASASYTTPADVDRITLRMRGDLCQGPPAATVSIDGNPPTSIDVGSTTYTDFDIPLTAGNGGAAGTHTLTVRYLNNSFDDTCDRNLYLDRVDVEQVPSVRTAIEPSPVWTFPALPLAATPSLALTKAKECAAARARRNRFRRAVRRARHRLSRAVGPAARKRATRLLHLQQRRLEKARRHFHSACA
jgi:glucose/arabinose dehydrogenase/PKD repeat protein